jgi:hypothetical protein
MFFVDKSESFSTERTNLILIKQSLTFDRAIHATDGCVNGVLMNPILIDNINGFANTSISNERSYNVNH